MAIFPKINVDPSKLITEISVTVDGQDYRVIDPRIGDWLSVGEMGDKNIESMLSKYEDAIVDYSQETESMSIPTENVTSSPQSLPTVSDTKVINHISPDDKITAKCINTLSHIMNRSNLDEEGPSKRMNVSNSRKTHGLVDMSTERKEVMPRIKRIMKDNLYERKILSKSGTLEGNRLAHHRVSNKLFSKKEEHKGKTYYIDLLLDCSGSMLDDGNRAYHAITACLNIGEILDNIAHIRVMCFGAVSTVYSYREFKNICEKIGLPGDISVDSLSMLSGGEAYLIVHDGYPKIVTRKDYLVMAHAGLRFDKITQESSESCTDDLAAIVNSYHYMKKQNGERCIIVMLDGEYVPLDHSSYNNIISMGYSRAKYNGSTYRKTLSSIQKDGIGIYALAIESYAVHKIRGPENHKRIWKVDGLADIFPGLVDIITKFVENT